MFSASKIWWMMRVNKVLLRVYKGRSVSETEKSSLNARMVGTGCRR